MSLPILKVGTNLSFMNISTPVLGSFTKREGFFLILKVPRPLISTFSPLVRASVIA